MTANQRVAQAIATTQEVLPDYWASTVAQRLPSSGAGSLMRGYASAVALEEALVRADWVAYSHPDLLPECAAFISHTLGGTQGLVKLVDLPHEQLVTLDDRKNTGMLSCVVSGCASEAVDYVVMILGPEEGREIVYTFHPGAPVRPSVVIAEPGSHGRQVTVAEAQAMGFELAKVG